MTTGKPPATNWAVMDQERQKRLACEGGVPSTTDEILSRAAAQLNVDLDQARVRLVTLERHGVTVDLDQARVRPETLGRRRLQGLRTVKHSDMAAQALLARPLRGLPVELRRLHEDRVAGDLDLYRGWRRLWFVWNFRLIQGRKLRRALTFDSVAERLP